LLFEGSNLFSRASFYRTIAANEIPANPHLSYVNPCYADDLAPTSCTFAGFPINPGLLLPEARKFAGFDATYVQSSTIEQQQSLQSRFT
jgi:hypothetical protein